MIKPQEIRDALTNAKLVENVPFKEGGKRGIFAQDYQSFFSNLKDGEIKEICLKDKKSANFLQTSMRAFLRKKSQDFIIKRRDIGGLYYVYVYKLKDEEK